MQIDCAQYIFCGRIVKCRGKIHYDRVIKIVTLEFYSLVGAVCTASVSLFGGAVLKKIGQQIGLGFLFGLGFAIALAAIIFVFEGSWLNTGDYAGSADNGNTEMLQSLMRSIDSNRTDQCDDVVGTWVGEFVEEDGAYIRSWELNYEEGGRFWGTMIRKSITEQTEEKQIGTWQCEGSVLFTDVMVGDQRHRWNYLLLHSKNGERVYAFLGARGLQNVYRSYRKKID